MKKVEVVVEYSLMKRMVVEVEDNKLWIATTKKVHNVFESEEDFNDLVSGSLPCEIFPTEIDQDDRMFSLVKIAIDKFDPFLLFPDAPEDEYDGESRNISERISKGMTEEEIADIIAKEFSFSFGQIFTVEDCRWPARYIYNFIKED